MDEATQLKRIHIALEQTGGQRKEAAELLGMSENQLDHWIRKHRELTSYAKDATPPSELETLGREPIERTPEGEIAMAVAKAERQVREGFAAIGVRGEALEQAIAFRNFGKFHFEDMRQYTGGSVAKLLADLMALQKKVVDDFTGTPLTDTEIQGILRTHHDRIVGRIIEVYDRVRDSALTSAIIEAKRKEMALQKGRGRPGFAPLVPAVAMSVQGNVTVNDPEPKGK